MLFPYSRDAFVVHDTLTLISILYYILYIIIIRYKYYIFYIYILVKKDFDDVYSCKHKKFILRSELKTQFYTWIKMHE